MVRNPRYIVEMYHSGWKLSIYMYRYKYRLKIGLYIYREGERERVDLVRIEKVTLSCKHESYVRLVFCGDSGVTRRTYLKLFANVMRYL